MLMLAEAACVEAFIDTSAKVTSSVYIGNFVNTNAGEEEVWNLAVIRNENKKKDNMHM